MMQRFATPELEISRFAKPMALILLATFSATLVTLSFPPYNCSWLAWIAFVPLLIACKHLKPGTAILVGLLSGFMAKNGVHFWIYGVPGFQWYHGLLLGLYMGSYTAAWCGFVALLNRKKLSLLLYASSLWVILDYIYANAGFLAFPWATLAQGQHTNLPVIQIAQYVGEYGISWLIIFVNVGISLVIIEKNNWKPAAFGGAWVVALILWGAAQLRESPDNSRKIRIAVVQPNIPKSPFPNNSVPSLPTLRKLTLEVAEKHPDVIIWPESSIRKLSKNQKLIAQITDLAKTIHTTLIIGSSENEKFVFYENDQTGEVAQGNYNAAWLINPSGIISRPYRKNLLVPFTEYIPLQSFVSWPDWLIPYIKSISPGDQYQRFILPGNASTSPIICWENLFSDYVRRAVKLEKPDFITHIVNDNWFGKSAAPLQHNMATVLRAVENRIPFAVASNTGPSEIIDAYGRVITQIPIAQAGITVSTIAIESKLTFFTKYGNVFVFFCILQLAAALILFINKPAKAG